MPRARKPKMGLMRIDAALDALRPMGFPESLVRRTVRNLLKAYGGDEGWTFIEEFSYKLLIDSVIEELEGGNKGRTFLEDGPSKDNIKEDMCGKQVHPSESDRHSEQVESSSNQSPLLQKQATLGDLPSNNSSPSPSAPCSLKSENSQVKLKITGVSSSELFSPPALKSKQVQSSSSQSPPPLKKLSIQVDSPGNNSSILVKAVPCSSKSNDSKGGQNTKESAAGSSTMALAPVCSNREAMAIELRSTASPTKDVPENALLTNRSEGNACLPNAEGEGCSGKDMNIEEDWKKKLIKNAEGTQDGSSHAGREVESKKQEIAKGFPSRRRRPYYGWISSDEEEEPIELVQLKPGPIPEMLAQSHSIIADYKNSKGRWDVKPEDM